LAHEELGHNDDPGYLDALAKDQAAGIDHHRGPWEIEADSLAAAYVEHIREDMTDADASLVCLETDAARHPQASQAEITSVIARQRASPGPGRRVGEPGARLTATTPRPLAARPPADLLRLRGANADLDANANAILIQSIKIEHEGWQRDTSVAEPAELQFDGLVVA
jgi:hypothetical protein